MAHGTCFSLQPCSNQAARQPASGWRLLAAARTPDVGTVGAGFAGLGTGTLHRVRVVLMSLDRLPDTLLQSCLTALPSLCDVRTQPLFKNPSCLCSVSG